MASALAEKRWPLGQVKSWQMMMVCFVVDRSLSLTASGVVAVVVRLLSLTDMQASWQKLGGLG